MVVTPTFTYGLSTLPLLSHLSPLFSVVHRREREYTEETRERIQKKERGSREKHTEERGLRERERERVRAPVPRGGRKRGERRAEGERERRKVRKEEGWQKSGY